MEKVIEIFNPGVFNRIDNLFNLDLNTQMNNHPTEIPKHSIRLDTSFPDWHMADVKKGKTNRVVISFQVV